ncbi:MAG TPA: S41 family peptidase [Thermotogota bacterium]|nr:S41 family peptidase [Thermotogota bacterium]HPJ88700.1 S41 family peptidase [Thermotogota bacterium]HPR95951.1 S41 family peptidase [Thermotogota bacterium]
MKKTLKTVFVITLATLILTTSWTLFAQTEETNVYDKLKPFFESLYFIENEFYEKDIMDYDDLIDSSVRGLISGLNDPFSYYHTAADVAETNIEQEGKYGGIGTEVTYNAHLKVIEVVAPMFGTPAYKAGIKAGDLIYTIDASPVEDMTYMEAVNNLRGVPDTIVNLEIIREGVGTLEFSLQRAEIKTQMVQYGFIEYMDVPIGYVRINKFFKNTSSELRKALTELYAQDIEKLVIDLRNNPGGYLTQAILTASMFIDSGEIIVTTKSSDNYTNTYKSLGNEFKDVPMVVLVNGGSASSSEIFSGAMKDYSLATLVGEKTFGKAAVQTLFPLSNGGELWLTTAHYFTPSGSDIHLKGIEPDILVKQEQIISDESDDSVDHTSDSTRFEIEINPEKDNQLKTALDFLVEAF